MRTVAVVNQYYPPDKASTGWLAKELVDRLRVEMPGWRVVVIATDATYRGGVAGSETEMDHDIIRLPSGNQLDRKLERLIGSLNEGRRMADAATAEADIVISMTNPPLVNYWMGRYAKRRGRKWVEWTLDLFPEAFASAGLIHKNNPIYRYFLRQYTKNFPDFNLFLGPQQRDFVFNTHRKTGANAILTCGIKTFHRSPEPSWRRENADKKVIGYIGNLGEAHSADTVEKIVRLADPGRFRFLFSLYGAKSEKLRRNLQGHPAVLWAEGIPDDELPWLDAQIVSLLPEWTHVCVPSKAVSAICAHTPIIYAGVKDADIWQFFKDAGWLIREGNESELLGDLQQALHEIGCEGALEQKRLLAKQLAFDQEDAYHRGFTELVRWIKEQSVSSVPLR